MPPLRSAVERAGAEVVEEHGSHTIYVSQHQAVAALVEKAARSLASATP